MTITAILDNGTPVKAEGYIVNASDEAELVFLKEELIDGLSDTIYQIEQEGQVVS